MMADDHVTEPGHQDTPMRINCMLIRRENSALFDELASFQKGPRRTARLKFLAYEGLRHLLRLTASGEQATCGDAEPVGGDSDAAQVHGATRATTADSLLPAPAFTRPETTVGIAAEIFGEPVENARLAR
jgi:hypothetical protein